MHPLLIFSAGIVAGAAALRLLKNEKTRDRLDNMQNQIRSAAMSGLSAVEQSSARWRQQLASEAPSAQTASGMERTAEPNSPDNPADKESATS